MKIDQTAKRRKTNLIKILGKFDSQRDFAEFIGIDPSQISQYVNGTRNLGEKTARRIEIKLGLAPYWFDTNQDPEAPEILRPQEDRSTYYRKIDAMSKDDLATLDVLMSIAERFKLTPKHKPERHHAMQPKQKA